MSLADLHRILIGTNKHDQVLLLIEDCLAQGIDTGSGIEDALSDFSFHRQHVGMLLRENTGHNPERHRWLETDDDRYALLA
jgi:hypothetical protein